MPKIVVSTVIKAPLDQVWPVAGAFDRLDAWAAPIKSCALEGTAGADAAGATRRLEMRDGTPIVERQTARSDAGDYFYTYEIVSSPLPVADYESTVRARPITRSNETFIEWSAIFEPKGIDERTANRMVQSYYAACLGSLEQKFGG